MAKSIADQIKEHELALAKLKEEQAKENFKSHYEVVDFLKEKKIDPKAFISWHRETFKQPILTVDLDLPTGKQTFIRYDTDLAAPKRDIKAALKALGRSTLNEKVNPEFKTKGEKFVSTLFT